MQKSFCDRCKKETSQSRLSKINATIPCEVVRAYMSKTVHIEFCYDPKREVEVCVNCMAEFEKWIDRFFLNTSLGKHEITIEDVAMDRDLRNIDA